MQVFSYRYFQVSLDCLASVCSPWFPCQSMIFWCENNETWQAWLAALLSLWSTARYSFKLEKDTKLVYVCPFALPYIYKHRHQVLRNQAEAEGAGTVHPHSVCLWAGHRFSDLTFVYDFPIIISRTLVSSDSSGDSLQELKRKVARMMTCWWSCQPKR